LPIIHVITRRLIECRNQFCDDLVPFLTGYPNAVSQSPVVSGWRVVAFYQLNLAVRATKVFHLLHAFIRLQLSLGAPLQFTVNSLVVGIPVPDQTLS
jgi:hypothetical protein